MVIRYLLLYNIPEKFTLQYVKVHELCSLNYNTSLYTLHSLLFYFYV